MDTLTVFPSAAGGQPSMPDEHTRGVLCSLRCMTAKKHETLEADSCARKNSMIQIHRREARLAGLYSGPSISPIYLTEHCAKVDKSLKSISHISHDLRRVELKLFHLIASNGSDIPSESASSAQRDDIVAIFSSDLNLVIKFQYTPSGPSWQFILVRLLAVGL